MSALDVAQWLQSLGLGRYEQTFRDNDIDGEVLADLDEADLEKLGVSLGHRKKLLKAIAALGETEAGALASKASASEVEGERRQVTVLFADLVGYTRLTRELGAEAMHEITDRFFSLADGVIERFGGAIDKHIGDRVMAVFGAPVAHGNDPERAVRAALAIRAAMPDLSRGRGCDLNTHIGIASGQVVAPRGRPARPCLAVEHGRLHAPDPRPRPSARGRSQIPGRGLPRCQHRTRPALRRPGRRNPLFLDQLLRHAEESTEGRVPSSVQSLVQARLDHLPPSDRQALQAASVLGQRFTPDALGHLLDRPDYDCANLMRHLLVRSIGDELLSAHALIRDGVYDCCWGAGASPYTCRRQGGLKGGIRRCMPSTSSAKDPRAPAAYLAAVRSQVTTYRYDVALDLAERGLAIARTRDQTFALTCLRGEILHDLGAMAEARDAYMADLEVATGDADRCPAWLGLAAVKRVTEDLDGAFADLERAEAAAQAQGLREQLARIHFLRGNLHFPRGKLEGCLEEHSKSLGHARAIGAADLEAAALDGLGDAEYARGRMLTAYRYFKHCIEVCREHGFGRIEVTSLPMAAITQYYAGDLPGAYADVLAAVRAAEGVGHQRAAIIGCHIVYFSAVARGEASIAREHVDRALALSVQVGGRRFEAEALWFHGEIVRAEGRHAEALATIREALAISRATGISFIGPAILSALARATDQAEERRAALAEGEQLLAAGSISHNYLWFYQDAIETSLEQRDWDGVERYAQALADYARAEPLPLIEFIVARGRALAAFARDPQQPDLRRDLEDVPTRAQELGWLAALPGLDAALRVEIATAAGA